MGTRIQIPKPEDEKEAIALLTHAVTEITQALGKIHEQLKILNSNLRQRNQAH
jgi:hypothetical protein